MSSVRDKFEMKLKFDGIPIVDAKMKNFNAIKLLMKELEKKFG